MCVCVHVFVCAYMRVCDMCVCVYMCVECVCVCVREKEREMEGGMEEGREGRGEREGERGMRGVCVCTCVEGGRKGRGKEGERGV